MKKAFLIFICIGILLGANYLLTRNIKKYILAELAITCSNVFGHQYHLEISNIFLNYFSRSVALNNLVVSSDTCLILKVDEIKFKGIGIWYFISKELTINRVSIDGVDFNYTSNIDLDNSSLNKNGANRKIKIKTLKVNNGQLHLNATKRIDIEEFSLRMNNIDFTQLKTINNIELNVHNLSYMDSSFHTLSIENIQINQKDSILRLDNLKYTPIYGKDEYAVQHPKHKDWYQFEVQNINLTGINIPSLFEKQLYADSLSIEEPNFQTYSNKNINKIRDNRSMLYSYIQNCPFQFKIAFLEIKKGNITYEELPLEGKKSGFVTFNNMLIAGKNFSNTEGYDYFDLNFKYLLMNKALFYSSLKFPLAHNIDFFEVEAKCDSLPFSIFNPITESLLKFRIKTGYSNKVHFKITGNSEVADINLLLPYQDLKILLLSDKRYFRNRLTILSSIANFLLIDSDNNSSEYVHATYQRDIKYSNFQYLWKTILSGLKIKLGFSKNKEKEIKVLQESAKKVQRIFKRKKNNV